MLSSVRFLLTKTPRNKEYRNNKTVNSELGLRVRDEPFRL